MTEAGKAINPKLQFFPLMYSQTPWAEFLRKYGSLVDGVVILLSEIGDWRAERAALSQGPAAWAKRDVPA